MVAIILSILMLASSTVGGPHLGLTSGQASEGYSTKTETIPLTRGIIDPQAFAVHQGVIYVLDYSGTLLTIKASKYSYSMLENGLRAGSLYIDDEGNLHAFQNLLPLDTHRSMTVFKDNKKVKTYPVPLNEDNKILFSTPDGTELDIYPQTLHAVPRPGGYLVTYANGQRWFLDTDTEEFRRYPDLVWESQPGKLQFILSGYAHEIETTGKAVAFHYIGDDDLGYTYHSFVDFVDPDNQHLIVIKAKGDQFLFANVTGLGDRRQITHLTVDRAEGRLYAAARYKPQGNYKVTRIGSDMFKSTYSGFTPQKPNWFNEGFTNPYNQLNLAAKTVNYLEKHLPPNPGFRQVDRLEVWQRGLEFVNYTYVPQSKNWTGLSNSVVGYLPGWLKTHRPGQEVRGVVYNWGGSDTLDVFQNNLNKGFQAGNVETVGPLKGGTTGVDCSGLVWVTYGYPSRPEEGTVLISSPRYWTRIQNKELVFMDMVRTPGHVVLFIALDPYDPDLFYTIESAITHRNDRTMFWYRRFSDGYHGFRYNGLLIPQTVFNTEPQACPGGTLQIVHRERHSYPVTLADGKTITRTINREKVQCSVCMRQWFR